MKNWNELWQYIGSHQDDKVEIIAQNLEMEVKLIRNLVFHWAVGDKEEFEKEFYESN